MKKNIYILITLALLTACHYADPGMVTIDPSDDIFNTWNGKISPYISYAHNIIANNEELKPDTTLTFKYGERYLNIKNIDDTHFTLTLDTLSFKDKSEQSHINRQPDWFQLQIEKTGADYYAITGNGLACISMRSERYYNRATELYIVNYNSGIFIEYTISQSASHYNYETKKINAEWNNVDLTAINRMTTQTTEVKVENNTAKLK